MKFQHLLFYLIIIISASSCIGDDIVFDTIDPEVRIMNPVDTIGLGETYQFQFDYFNNVGQQVSDQAGVWTSSNPDIISIDANGLATAIQVGNSEIQVETEADGFTITDTYIVAVGENTVVTVQERSGSIRTTSSYALEGDFTLSESESGIELSFENNYNASTALPGLYVYLTNNPNTTSGALEIGRVETFSGIHTYQIENAGVNDYSHVLYFCKPFNVKVGDGQIQ